MRKKVTIDQVICDICGEKAVDRCELCGKDICCCCIRKICSVETQIPGSGGYSSWAAVGWSNTPYKELMTICASCVDSLKLSIRIASTKENKTL